MLEMRGLVDMSLQPFQAHSHFLPSALAHKEALAFVAWQVPLPGLGRCQCPTVFRLSGCPGCWLETPHICCISGCWLILQCWWLLRAPVKFLSTHLKHDSISRLVTS